MMTATRITRVAYKGIQQAITDVVSGQIHLVFDNLPSILPHVKSGRLRVLAVTSLKRSNVLPDVPTLDEGGLTGFERLTWAGYLAPARIPRDVLMRLNAEINKTLALPAVRERYSSMGYTTVGGTPEQFAGHIQKELDKWSKVIKTVGIKAE
jgi:tripartite-type tricarboxylate transporter receptor subunit TctC